MLQIYGASLIALCSYLKIGQQIVERRMEAVAVLPCTVRSWENGLQSEFSRVQQ